MSKRRGALADLRVIDLTQMLAGPFGTQMLADQGADVIKVEALGGDVARLSGPHLRDDALKAYGGYFQSINRNKSSIALDLKSERGRDILKHLVRDADVVAENFRVGVMERLGLSYETLRAENPRLIYASVRGFGDPRTGESAYANWPAFDVVAQAMGGMMGITGADPLTPVKIGPGIGDMLPGMYMAFGILAAVHHVSRTGQGQFVDVSMVDAVLAVCERIVHQYFYAGTVPTPEGNQHPFLCPFGLFKTNDGWMSIACPTEDFWRILTAVMGRPQMALDERYADNTARVRHKDDVVEAVEAFTSRHSKRELIDLLGGRIPIGPVYDAKDIAEDEHFRKRDMIVSLEHPGSDIPAQIAGVPVKLTGTPGGVYQRAPLLGEQTDALLTGLGLSAYDIEQLREARVVA